MSNYVSLKIFFAVKERCAQMGFWIRLARDGPGKRLIRLVAGILEVAKATVTRRENRFRLTSVENNQSDRLVERILKYWRRRILRYQEFYELLRQCRVET